MKADKDTSKKLQSQTKSVSSGGQPFIFYRVFYCKQFNPLSQLFPRESVGICYLLGMGLSLSLPTLTSSTGTFAIAPPVVSTKKCSELLGPRFYVRYSGRI